LAYSAIWDETVPTGAEAANTIGTIFRNLKRDVDERLIDIFGMPSFATDPLRPYVLKFSSVPGTNDIIPGATSFRFRDVANANNNVTISDAGNVVIRGTLTSGAITGTTITVTTSVSVTGAASIIGGTVKGDFGANKDLLLQPGNAAGNVTFVSSVGGTVGTISNTGNLAVNGSISGATGALGGLSITNGASVGITINTTTNAVTDLIQIFFQRGGANKWRLGTNIDGLNTDSFNIYNEAGTVAVTISKATSVVNIPNGITVAASINGTVNSNIENAWNIINNDTTTANYGTQASIHLQVGGVDVGALKTTNKDLGGLVGRSLYLTTRGAYHVAFGINDSASPVGYFHGTTGVFHSLNGIVVDGGTLTANGGISTTGTLAGATVNVSSILNLSASLLYQADVTPGALVPTTSLLYREGGALKYKGTAGTVTVIAPA
jgi:hypothetical protein